MQASADEMGDSLQRSLEEVTVEAASQAVTPEKTVFIPEAKQKKASQDGIALLARMSIPTLQVNPVTSSVSTTSGESVKIFIDYLPASSDDITGMRMKDVRKVEIYNFPDDPRFQGAEHVVNFIMQKYEYGGYAKLFNQMFASHNSFVERPRVNSKFNYKRMTYDLVVGGDAVDSKVLRSGDFSTFRFPQPDGSVNEIHRDSYATKAGKLQYHTIYTTLRAVYNTEKIQISNSVGFNYCRQPHFDKYGTLEFTGIDLPGSESSQLMNRLWRTAQWSGDYYFALPHDFSLVIEPSVDYSYTERHVTYLVDDSPTIENNADSKTTGARLNLRLNRKLNDKFTLWAEADGMYSRNSVKYRGSSPGDVTLDNKFFGPGLGMSFRLSKLYMSIDGGCAMEWNDTGTTSDREVYPYLHLSANYAFSDKLSWNVWTQFASNTPDAADRSPIVQQQNELLWTTGNPDLDNSHHFTFHTSATWLPSNKFQFSGYVSYFHLFNQLLKTYTPAVSPTGQPVMMSYLHNQGDYNRFRCGIYGTLKLLKNSLQLSAGTSLATHDVTGYNLKKTYQSWNVMANYYLKNFNFSAYYYAPSRAVSMDSAAETWDSASYAVSAGWANNDWSVQVYGMNFFTKDKTSSRSTLNTPWYRNHSTLENGNNMPTLYLTLSYAIGYGKQVKRGDEVKQISTGSDGILH
ncbi:MAG: hypothetical protein ACI30D_02920 [Muribaculaceae bacterium]